MAAPYAFEERVRQIERKHRALAQGSRIGIDPSGLVVARPARRQVFLPVRGMVFLVAGFILFKAILYATLGEATYQERLAQLREGTIVEKAGAWALQDDRLTHMIAAKLRPYLG